MPRELRGLILGDEGVAVGDLHQPPYLDPCPVATVALEVASANDRLRQATADVFGSWIDGATERYAGRASRRRRLARSAFR